MRRLAVGAEAGCYHAGVAHSGGDPGTFQAAAQLVGEHHVGQLRLAVSTLPRVVPLPLQVAEVNSAAGVGAGGDGHDPGRCVSSAACRKMFMPCCLANCLIRRIGLGAPDIRASISGVAGEFRRTRSRLSASRPVSLPRSVRETTGARAMTGAAVPVTTQKVSWKATRAVWHQSGWGPASADWHPGQVWVRVLSRSRTRAGLPGQDPRRAYTAEQVSKALELIADKGNRGERDGKSVPRRVQRRDRVLPHCGPAGSATDEQA